MSAAHEAIVGDRLSVIGGRTLPAPITDHRSPIATDFPLARLTPFLVAGVTLAVAMLTMGAWPVGVFQDDGIYVILAKSLATGEGYRYLNLPGQPAATHYPPGYPALLALLWWISPSFPGNVALFKMVNAVLLAAAATGAYVFARRRLALGALSASLGSVAAAASVPMLILAGIVLSEPLFLAVLFPTLLVAERAAERDGAVRDAALAGALAGGLTLVRTLGIVALPAMAAVLVLRRRYAHAAVAMAAGVAVLLPWQLWVAAHDAGLPAVLLGKYGSYTGWFAEALRSDGLPFALAVVKRNLVGTFDLGAILFSATMTPWVWVRIAAVVALALVLGAGFARMLRLAPIAALFVAGYLAIVIVWPFAPDRFLWGIWPVLGVIFAGGVSAAWQWRAPVAAARVARVAMLGAAACLVAGYGWYNVRGFRGHWYDSIQRKAAERAKPLAEWVARYTDPRDVLVTDDDVLLYLYTGRTTIPNGTFTPQEHLRPQPDDVAARALSDIVARYRPRYVLVSTSVPARAALHLTRASPPQLRFLGSLTQGAVLEPVK